MNKTEQTCDTDRIDDYLEERLSDSALVKFEEHLSDCNWCQSELQERAAEPEVWRDAVALLGNGSNVSAYCTDEERSDGQRKRHVLSILDSLMPTDEPEMLGRIGDYEISGVVGVGGMGTVLKGFDKSLRRVVAIKVMAPHLADSGSARARFQREARAAAAITHNNVIDTYGVSEANGLPYLVMPFARGPSLQKRIDESGPLTVLEIVRIGRQIASGLAAAHEQGLVHRDIKPANILLNEGIERLWITDFGVAHAMDDASMTQTGVIAGTPQYMSPEQARGESVDYRSDLFSMGSVLYTACTGRPPFRSEAAYGILRRITDTDPRPIRELNPDIPEWLCRVIERLMAKHPADRFQNAGEVAELLEGCLAHLQQPTQVELPQCVALPKRPDETVFQQNKGRARQSNGAAQPRSLRIQRTGVWLLVSLMVLGGLGFVALQLTEPAEIAGDWTGENWKNVSLSAVEEANDWYTGSFTDTKGRRGALQLEWSRLQSRYNGRWKVGNEQAGSITLRVRGGKLRGAVSVDPDSKVASNLPRLREFSWQRVPAGTVRAEDSPRVEKLPGRPTSIESPIKGRIVRWGNGIYENARVKKGALIAEIANSDPKYLDRIKEQMAASRLQTDAAQALVQANERNLETANINVDALESQLKAYEKVKLQLLAAADAAIDFAKDKVEAKKAELTKFEAALKEAQSEFNRQKKLFDQKTISQLKFEEVKRKLNVANTKVEQTTAQVQSAENDLVTRQNDRNVKESKAQVDVVQVTSQLKKAQGEVVNAESEVAKAKIELAKAQKATLDLKTKLSRETKQMIYAPFDGFVTHITSNTLLKEGDVICVMWPNRVQQAARVIEDSSADVVPAEQRSSLSSLFRPDSVAGISKFSGLPGRLITETFGPASALRRRFRETRTSLQTAEKNLAALQTRIKTAEKELADREMQLSKTKTDDPNAVRKLEQSVLAKREALGTLQSKSNELKASIANLKENLNAAEAESATAIAILKTQIEAAKKLHSSQTDLTSMLKHRVQQGFSEPGDLPKAEQAEATTAVEIRQLEVLLNYYTNLEKEDLSTAENERITLLEILKLQVEAAKKRHHFQSEQNKRTKHRFEQGNAIVDDVLKAEQAVASVAAEVHQLEALLEYYGRFGKTNAQQNAPWEAVLDNNDVLIRPKTNKERLATIEVLSARLKAATAKLEQAQQELERQKHLFEKSIISAAKFDAAKTAVTELEAAVKELNIKIDYYKSGRFEK
ncbi:protein kinase domain-containing protein [Gimesia aquarii]|uniref:non-specific serine/threonine protein kinase n=1 Tax=Gimesia aquarii TaxID=2527964 RepID=A0A517WTY4_9PLAN|nr:protein kinase [Gimesia aquarii]QDU08719.1 Serine/threonine-protein kinase PrkC [Gimesia aquarii]